MEWISVVLAGPYNAAYGAAFAVGGVLAVRAGRRAGWPMLPWLALFAACAAGGIVGSRLLHFHLEPGLAGEKTILGGMVGGGLALLVAARALGFPRSAADRLVPALAGGFALGRVGCFLAGCCFGRPTALPWGVSYGAGTDAYQQQIASGLIPAGAAATLPVHPTQLYEAAAALLISALVWRLAPRLRRDGSPFLAFAVAFGSMRFLVEPLRADGLGSAGLTPVQWTLALVVPLLLALLVLRERGAGRSLAGASRPTPHAAAPASIALAVLALSLLGAGWLTPLEQLTLMLLAIPPLLLACGAWIRRSALVPAPGLAAMALVLQVSPEPILQAGDSYVTLGAGAMTGRYEDTCGGVYDNRSFGGTLGYTRVTGPDAALGIHGQAFSGSEGRVQDANQPGDQRRDPRYGAGIRGQLDRRGYGIGVGMLAGQLTAGEYAEREVVPTGRLRVGTLSGLHFDGRIMDHEPAPLPAPVIQLGVGYGIGETGSAIRAGVSDAGLFGGGRLVTAGGFELEPFFGYAGPDTYQFSLALRQRIGQGR
jgi:prolipoprotein diacylglyceryltransferase